MKVSISQRYGNADYGFEYSDEEVEEEDVDIENQYYNSKGRAQRQMSAKIPSSMQTSFQKRHICRSAGEQRPNRSFAGVSGSGQDGARQG